MKIGISGMVLIFAGGAFYLGWLLGKSDQSVSVGTGPGFEAVASASRPDSRETWGEGRAGEIDALRADIRQLEAELEATEAKLNESETGAMRYAAVRERLLRDQSISIRFSFNQLSVPEGLQAVLNLEKSEQEKLEAVFEETFAEIREWERATAVVQEHSDDGVVYRLPASDMDFSERVGASLQGVLSEDDHELVVTAFKETSEKLSGLREISVELLEHDDPEMITYRVRAHEIDADGRRLSGSTSTSSYPRDRPFRVDRWSHLVQVE